MKKLWLHDILETERCILKIPEESEAEYIWSLITEDTTKYMIWDKGDDFSSTLESIIKTRKNASDGTWWEAAIYDKNTGECIWRCGINRVNDGVPLFELWYWISEKYYGKWIMPECIKRYLCFAFEESDFEKVVIRCNSKNENSKKVALKTWFILEWTFRKNERINGKLRDTTFYWITKTDYLDKK